MTRCYLILFIFSVGIFSCNKTYDYPYHLIESIEITNWNGTTTLNNDQTLILKEKLKTSNFLDKGTLFKPGHISLIFKFTDGSKDYVLAKYEKIIIESVGSDTRKQYMGTYGLSQKINFDNYK
jgi:hypothetical protein